MMILKKNSDYRESDEHKNIAEASTDFANSRKDAETSLMDDLRKAPKTKMNRMMIDYLERKLYGDVNGRLPGESWGHWLVTEKMMVHDWQDAFMTFVVPIYLVIAAFIIL